jgi:hypothetical protein
MGGTGLGALEAAKGELVRALSRLEPSHRFQVIAYNQKCAYLHGVRSLLAATDRNVEGVRDFLAGLAAFGGTEHELALGLALSLKPDVVFLLTDGADPHLSAPQLRQIQKLAAGRTSIHCVQFGSGPLQDKDNFMMRLSRQNNGGYQYVQMSRP